MSDILTPPGLVVVLVMSILMRFFFVACRRLSRDNFRRSLPSRFNRPTDEYFWTVGYESRHMAYVEKERQIQRETELLR